LVANGITPECFSYIANNYKGMWYSKNIIIILHVLSSSGRGNFPNKVVALNADSLFVCLLAFGAIAPSGPRSPHSRGF
jgi:hypothetical protein